MNNVWLALPSVFDSFVWTLVWQSTLWLALGLFVGRMLRPHPARAHLALVLAALAALISPVLTRTARHLEWGVLPSPRAAQAAVATQTPFALVPADAASGRPAVATPAASSGQQIGKPEMSPSAAAMSADRIQSWSTSLTGRVPKVLFAVWIACSLALSLRLAASLQAGRHVVRQASAETDAGRLAALGDAVRTLAIGSAPALRVSTAVRCPMIWCWGRQPVLIAPRSIAGHDKLSWSAIFRHELAHWLRRDHWAALCADLVVIAVWWQPLAWRVRRRLALLREQACDDWVLATGGTAADYAESLLSLVPERHPAVGLSVLGSSQSLKERLERLFTNVRVVPRVGTARVALAVTIVAAAIVSVSLAQQRSDADKPASRAKATNSALQDHALVENRTGARRFSGHVLQPDGKPAAGAQVYFTRSSTPPDGGPQAMTGSQGEFEFTVGADALFGALWLRIVAVKLGFGPVWIDAGDLKKTSGLTLTLANDEMPIEGRLLNLEGRPVAGATVRVEEIRTFAKDDPAPYVKLLKTDALRASNFGGPWLSPVPQAPSARTDEQGSFRLTGVGRHRRAELAITGDAIADTRVEILTDPFAGMLNVPDASLSEPPVYGARFVHHVRPSRSLVGTVTDAKTGLPIAGARVFQFPPVSRAVTDAAGRFELRGCAKTDQYRICATLPGAQATYISGGVTATDAPGLAPLQVDLHLYPAIPLTGRVIDRVTGKPVPAQVTYWPLYHNPHIVRGMSGTAIRASGPWSTSFTKPDGSFSVGVLPGPGAVVVDMPAKSAYEPAHVDADAFFEKQRVPYGRPEWRGTVDFDYLVIAVGTDAASALPQSQFQGIALLNVPEAATQITQNIDVHSKTKRVGRDDR
jgi:beta-lactamase regulating signal transducer with metallopeptidase domain